MSNLFSMALFRKKPVEIAAEEAPVTITVPDIKEYLLKEYERTAALQQRIAELEAELEEALVLDPKYKATLVTLNEYSKRLSVAEEHIERLKAEKEKVRRDAVCARDEINSYKIKLNNAAIEKEEMRAEVEEELRAVLIQKINAHKGNVSKKIVCEIIGGM
ncbi:MAG: hypothetical protein IKY33_01535 [Clostridia bacterium]|nr:hypothetical protein [Clostridia bacterium]